MLNLVSALLSLVIGIITTVLFFVAPPSFLTAAPATLWWVCLVLDYYKQKQMGLSVENE